MAIGFVPPQLPDDPNLRLPYQQNRSDRPRRGLVINVFRDGVISDSDGPPLKGIPPVPKGQKMAGQFFPLLFDPRALGG